MAVSHQAAPSPLRFVNASLRQALIKPLPSSSAMLSAVYTATSSGLILATLRTFYKLCSFPRKTGDVPQPSLEPPRLFTEKLVPLEVADRNGELRSCDKDQCGGRWKPPRCHHCSQCGVCKMEFDHHVRSVLVLYHSYYLTRLTLDQWLSVPG